MKTRVELSDSAVKDLRKIPRFIIVRFEKWVKTVHEMGPEYARTVKGYITMNHLPEKETYELRILTIIEVNKHEY
jgi:mRNA-degrading endonuclease RelE of RelBE toxin-antitoxin system